jgi:hypothetical protein
MSNPRVTRVIAVSRCSPSPPPPGTSSTTPTEDIAKPDSGLAAAFTVGYRVRYHPRGGPRAGGGSASFPRSAGRTPTRHGRLMVVAAFSRRGQNRRSRLLPRTGGSGAPAPARVRAAGRLGARARDPPAGRASRVPLTAFLLRGVGFPLTRNKGWGCGHHRRPPAGRSGPPRPLPRADGLCSAAGASNLGFMALAYAGKSYR